MKLFLDTSVLLAACGSTQGSSRALFQYAPAQGWELLASPWVLGEVTRNLVKFPVSVTADWLRLRRHLVIVDDVVSLDRALVFPVSKDRPVLLSALASAQVLPDARPGGFHGPAWRSVLRAAHSAALRFSRIRTRRGTAPELKAGRADAGGGDPGDSFTGTAFRV